MNQSYYDFKLLTHLLNANQIQLLPDEFKGILEALEEDNLSEMKKSFSPLGKLVARVFEVEPLKERQYYFVEWGNQAVAVTSSADLLAVLLKAAPENADIRVCTER
ncbi:hypothetical protein [uncultured Granulicatella sp.]|uniref:hypothetical protein n=1 Tax=uncultured Granulicatella sp. TaxID=316089 RepID=UPI0028D271CF|nr:hypothetical protein [uncultured Granulicatella sp.]